jgi:lactoylglutathione lyase
MSVISVFFRDPDDHLIEYLVFLNDESHPSIGIIPLFKWSDHRERIDVGI